MVKNARSTVIFLATSINVSLSEEKKKKKQVKERKRRYGSAVFYILSE